MFIEELILDGFKSYQQRTVISGWDSAFNAITGLNGSGKSNILDAICFVLGLTNLSQVRAQNLQDLVYKRGQAGINRATVTVVFNNEDKQQSPVGFENLPKITVSRQVVIGGKNKYLINGHLAQQQAVTNLFQSVQLNINNPHFLIMQGRITKVLNMKPQEILAMIEEAAGTRMFEEKKDRALKTIAKKDQKLQEITEIMDKDIAPKLEKLKKEKSDFLQFQKIEGEMERLRRYLVAFDFMKAQQKLNQSVEDLEEKQRVMEELEEKLKSFGKLIKEIQQKMTAVQSAKNKELKKKTEFQALQASVNELGKELTKLTTQLELKQTAIKDEQSSIESTQTQQEKLNRDKEMAQTKYEKLEKEFVDAKRQVDKQSIEARKKEEFLQTLTTGISAQEGKENGFAEQIEEQRALKMEAITRCEVAKNRIGFLKDSVKGKQSTAKSAEKEQAQHKKQFDALTQEIQEMKTALGSVEYDPSREKELKERRESLKDVLLSVQEELDALTGQMSNLNFQYADPYKGFDRSKVKGLVAKLIKIDPAKLDFSTALQVCAEGRLFYVVVEDNKIASEILKNGQLKRKYTIIPIKQIQPTSIAPDRIKAALKMAPGRVEHALSLVGYESEVRRAMEYVFGSTLICKDAEAAKKVAYDPSVRMRAITLDGDIYEPGATITGGSRPTKNSDLLIRLHKLRQLEEKFADVKEEYECACRELEQYEEIGSMFKDTQQMLRRKEYEFQSLEKLMRESPAGLLLKEIEDAKSEIDELDKQIKDATQEQFSCDKRVKELEKEMKEFAGDRDGKIKKLEKDVQKSKKDLSNSEQKLKNQQRILMEAKDDVTQLTTEISTLTSQMNASKETIMKLESELSVLKSTLDIAKQKYDNASAELSRQSSLFQKFDDELKDLEDEKKMINEQTDDAQLKLKRLSHDIEQFHQDKQAAEDTVRRLMKEHDWIEDQQANFGKPNTAFDFSVQNSSECRKRLKQLEQEHDSLRKRINVKVMNMIDRVMTKEKSLKQMLATVCRDKSKIEETIEQLDQYKKEALMRTWTKVNSDFGSIFDELLPGGNTAKLVAPEGQTINEGLEVKVCLGGVWKQSLTELSGGQRSLVALSLILSLLQFKPAPMYILDEIDAALDLSHTQNIGHLFKNRFKGSQFIVVSLKEGMFNNANVLFKARFRDGTSVVERFTQGQTADENAKPGNNKIVSKKESIKETQVTKKRARRVLADDAAV